MQVLVHVSTSQGSILVPVFEPQPHGFHSVGFSRALKELLSEGPGSGKRLIKTWERPWSMAPDPQAEY